MKELFSKDKVNYILRTYLPTWNYSKRIEEILQFCEATDTRHVMLFTDAQDMVWNQLTLEEAEREAKNIAKAKERLSENGIRLGINSTYNMPQSRWDNRAHCDYDFWATYADGTTEYRTPCLLDPKLELYLQKYFAILAEVSPDYIFIDDDHRYIFMGQKNTWGCFCDLHVRKFSEITGQKWTRQTLNKALENDQPIREQWINFLGNRLEEIATIISQSVHKVNPEIEVGIMVPCVHALPAMGHTIKNMIKAFNPVNKPLVRPCIGPYNDRDRRQIIPGLYYLEFIGHLLGDNISYTPEIETTPFSRFSKSLSTVKFCIAQALLNGMNNPALSLCGYSGDSPFFEPTYVDFLKKNRPYFETINSIVPKLGSRKGVQLLWDFEGCKKRQEPIKAVADVYLPAFTLHDILGNLGFTYTYDESPVRFLIGDTAWGLSEERIKELLKAGLVLDADAARILIKRGFGEMIGCSYSGKVTGFGAEKCISEKYFGQYRDTYIPLKAVPLDGVFKFTAHTGTEEISQLVNHDLEVISPGVILFVNDAGGKIAVLPYKIGPQDTDLRHFICYQRQHMFQKVFKWMSPESIPVTVADPSDFAVQYWQDENRTTICLTNLSYDIADEVIIELQDSGNAIIENTSFIDDDGIIYPLRERLESLSCETGSKWKLKGNFPIFKPFIILIKSSPI